MVDPANSNNVISHDVGPEEKRACVAANIEKTKNFSAGLGSPVSFGSGVRLSAPVGGLLKIDFAGKQFVPVK